MCDGRLAATMPSVINWSGHGAWATQKNERGEQNDTQWKGKGGGRGGIRGGEYFFLNKYIKTIINLYFGRDFVRVLEDISAGQDVCLIYKYEGNGPSHHTFIKLQSTNGFLLSNNNERMVVASSSHQ